jgi:O-antigen/teichoic acid export membrane protein
MKHYITLIRDFLTKNTSSKQTVIKNTFWLLLAEGVSKGSLAVLIIMIWRIFWKEIFGQYSYLSVILTFLVVFADLGITQLTVRDYQHLDEKHRRQYLITWLWTKLLLSIAVTVVYIGILWWTVDTSFLWIIGMMLLWNNLTNSFLEYIRSTFRSLQKWETELRIKLIQWLGNCLLIPLLFVYQSLPLNLLGQSVVTLVTIGYAWWLVHKRQLADHMPEMIVTKKELVSKGWMFSMSALFVVAYYFIDSLIIQYYWGFKEVGVYNASSKLIYIWLMFLSTLGAAVFPSFSKLEFKWMLRYKSILLYTLISVFIWFSIGLLFYFFSNEIISSLYWNEYENSANILKFLSISFFLNSMRNIIWYAIMAKKPLIYSMATLITIFINIALGLVLIPKYGAIWASYSMILTETGNLIIYWILFTFLFKK